MTRIVDLGTKNPYHALGGVEAGVYNTNRGLVKAGFDVITICHANNDFVIEKTDMGKIIGLKVPENEFLRFLTYPFRASKLAAKLKPDVIMGDGAGNFGASILSSIFRKKGVIRIERCHGTHMQLIMSTPKKTLHMMLLGRLMVEVVERYSFSMADHIIVVSYAVEKELMKHYGIPKERMTVIHFGGVDTKLYYPLGKSRKRMLRERLGFVGTQRCLVYVGTDPYRKGLDVALSTMLLLDKKRFRLNVIGVTDQEGRRFIDTYGIDRKVLERVTFLGRIEDSNKVAYIQASDAMLFPSRYESMGLVVLEALSCGIPAIISKNVAAQELAGKKQGMLVVNSFNPKDYAAMVSMVFANQLKLEEMGRRGRHEMLQYDWEIVSRKYSQEVKNIVGNNTQ